MQNRRPIFLFLLVILSLLAAGVGAAYAQSGGGGRTEDLEFQVTQYVWELVSHNTRAIVCKATVEHEGTPTYFETLAYCPMSIFSWAVTPEPTVSAGTPQPARQEQIIDEATLFKYYKWQYKEAFQVTRKVKVTAPDMVVYMAAPVGYLDKPYVIISAYEPLTLNSIARIAGIINGRTHFNCPGSRCEVPLSADATIEYWAENSAGESSQHNTGTVRYSLSEQGYRVTLEAIPPVKEWTDACALKFGIDVPGSVVWARMPITPVELNTYKTLHFLTGKLIINNQVDTSDCPGGGFLENVKVEMRYIRTKKTTRRHPAG